MTNNDMTLGLYEAVKHILGECSADGHACNYDSGGSDKGRSKQAEDYLKSFITTSNHQAVEEFAAGLKEQRYTFITKAGLRHEDIIDVSDIDVHLKEFMEREKRVT